MLPVFAYWSGTEFTYEHDFHNAWSKIFESFRIYDLDAAMVVAATYFPRHVELIEAIALPSAQSDICRFIMLYEHGGLYTDCHFGITDGDALKSFYSDAHQYDVLAIDNKLWRDRRSEKQTMLINGFVFAQPRHPLVLDCILRTLKNLEQQQRNESQHGWREYDIWRLSGPWILNSAVFDNVDANPSAAIETIIPVLKTQYKDTVKIVREEDLPVRRNMYSCNQPGRHWYERQKHECLFRAPSPNAT